MAELLPFNVWAESGRGLMARPVLPNNIIALRAHIAQIDYEVWDITDTPPTNTDNGTVDVSEVMLEAPATWKYDKLGYTFLWPASGELWPDPQRTYRVSVNFTISNFFGASLLGKKFRLVWEPRTRSITF